MRFTPALCVGALGLALLGSVAVAAPASAAPKHSSRAATVTGPLVFQASWGSTTYFGYQVDSDGYVRSLSGSGGESKGFAMGRADTATFPAAGSSGPITVGGRCLTIQSGLVWALSCTGSTAQNFSWSNGGPVLTSTGLKLGSVWGPAIRNVAISTFPSNNKDWFLIDPTTMTKPAAPVDITTPTNGSTIQSGRPTYSGTGDPSASVALTDETGRSVGTGTVGSDGRWSVPSSVELGNGAHTITATQTATDKTVTNDTTRFTVSVPAQVTPVKVTSPATGSTVGSRRPVVSGTGEPGALVAVTDEAGRSLGSATVGSNGQWALTPTVDLANGSHTVTANQTKDGVPSSDSTTFTVAEVARLTAEVVSVDADARTALIHGTGQPNVELDVTGPDGAVQKVAVGADGHWSATVPNLVDGDNAIHVKQVVGNDTQKKDLVATLVPAPIVQPAIAGGGIAAIAALGAVLIRRRRNS